MDVVRGEASRPFPLSLEFILALRRAGVGTPHRSLRFRLD